MHPKLARQSRSSRQYINDHDNWPILMYTDKVLMVNIWFDAQQMVCKGMDALLMHFYDILTHTHTHKQTWRKTHICPNTKQNIATLGKWKCTVTMHKCNKNMCLYAYTLRGDVNSCNCQRNGCPRCNKIIHSVHMKQRPRDSNHDHIICKGQIVFLSLSDTWTWVKNLHIVSSMCPWLGYKWMEGHLLCVPFPLVPKAVGSNPTMIHTEWEFVQPNPWVNLGPSEKHC